MLNQLYDSFLRLYLRSIQLAYVYNVALARGYCTCIVDNFLVSCVLNQFRVYNICVINVSEYYFVLGPPCDGNILNCKKQKKTLA